MIVAFERVTVAMLFLQDPRPIGSSADDGGR